MQLPSLVGAYIHIHSHRFHVLRSRDDRRRGGTQIVGGQRRRRRRQRQGQGRRLAAIIPSAGVASAALLAYCTYCSVTAAAGRLGRRRCCGRGRGRRGFARPCRLLLREQEAAHRPRPRLDGGWSRVDQAPQLRRQRTGEGSRRARLDLGAAAAEGGVDAARVVKALHRDGRSLLLQRSGRTDVVDRADTAAAAAVAPAAAAAAECAAVHDEQVVRVR